jgi:hypothetical protein
MDLELTLDDAPEAAASHERKWRFWTSKLELIVGLRRRDRCKQRLHAGLA